MESPPYSVAPDSSGTEIRTFLQAHFENKPAELYVLVWTLPDKKSRWFQNLDKAAEHIEKLKGQDVYVGVGYSPTDFGPDKRCEADQIAGISGFWGDIDIAGPAHKKKYLPPDLDTAIKIAESVGIGPTMIVDSGHGLQPRWLLKEQPWIFMNETDRTRAKKLAKRFNKTLQERAKALGGYAVDSTHDLARVLRVPGTMNCKIQGEKVPARLLEYHPDRRYDLADIEKLLVVLPDAEEIDPACSEEAVAELGFDLDALGSLVPDPEIVRMFLEIDPGFANTYSGRRAGAGVDDSPSGNDHALLVELIVYADITDEGTLCGWIFQRRKDCGDDLVKLFENKTYLPNTIRHAKENAARHPHYDGKCQMKVGTIDDAAAATSEGAEQTSDSLLGAKPNEWPTPHDVFDVSSLTGDPDVSEQALPTVIYSFAADEAARLGVNTTPLALACLVACASVVDDKFKVQPKTNDTEWQESPRLWGAIVGDPGTKKTATLMKAADPLKTIEADLYAVWVKENKEYEKRLGAYLKSRQGKHSVERDKPEPPIQPRLLMDDVTVEAVSEALREENKNSKILLCADELGGLIASMDCYKSADSRGKDRAAMLELWNGGPKFIDRVKRGRVYVPNWSSCILGGIQPDLVQRLVKNNVVADGFTERFNITYIKNVGDGEDRRPNFPAISAYRKLIHNLREMKPESHAAVFKLSPAAQDERSSLNTIVRSVLTLPEVSHLFRGHLAKWPGMFARLTLLYHLIEHASAEKGPLEEHIQQQAAERVGFFMVDVLLPHAARFYHEVMPGTGEAKHARWIAGHILAKGLGKISAYDIARVYREVRANRTPITTAMQALETFGWVRPLDQKRDGPTKWKVNPLVHERFAERAARERRERADIMQRIHAARGILGIGRQKDEEV